MLECDEKYIRESSRSFRERFMEYLQVPSLIYDHGNITGHHTRVDNFSIVVRETQNLTRTIKEAMYIRVNDLPLNKSIGKFQLSHIRDELQLSTPDQHLKMSLPHSSCPLHCPTSPFVGQWCKGDTQLCSTLHNIGRHVVLYQQFGLNHLAPGVTFVNPLLPSVLSTLIVSITFSHRPDKAIFLA